MSKRAKPKPRPKPRPTRPGYIERAQMHFCTLDDDGAPPNGSKLLVRIHDGTFVFGAVVAGRFAAYDRHSEEFVTYAHPERITHWMQIIDPVPRGKPADMDQEADFQACGEAPGRAEDVYA